MKMKRVWATQMEPQTLACWSENKHGLWLGDAYPGVALPSVKAKGKPVVLRYGDRSTIGIAADVGPWCEDDDSYVFGDARPRAEEYKGRLCPRVAGTELVATLPDGTKCEECNGAGIDLFPAVYRALGIPEGENVMLEWCFLDAMWAEVHSHV